ncbi:CBS domain-containing protein [Flavobacterium agricola]|uniref:CBS domain-containing protein n=1 Tax=Flavobacterium agricola TaxID=2870839 RepID=A0ABY6LXE5_9FLAO|nr:CBS domain-containing protein [Flavobacterium agricola]UYW00647.1 CBS domain-containing protein [Flavobacterium agricola]
MKALDPVSRIMTSNLVKLNYDDQLTKAEDLFKKHKIRHLPVVRANQVIGMLSYTDLQKVCFADQGDDAETNIETVVYNAFTLEQVMSKQVLTVFPWTPIKEVAILLSEANFNALPVVEHDKLVGIVTTIDLLKYYISQYEE